MIFNMVGGGGGGLKNTDAVLIVTVPTGSTVTATKSGVTLTPTIWVQNADNTLDTAIFAIKASAFDSVNPWTVTASLGTYTKSETIIIDAPNEYQIEIGYTLYLLKDGVGESGYEFSNSVTYVSSSDKGNVTSHTGYVQLTTTGGYVMVWSSTSKADLTNYNTLYAHIDLVTSVTDSGVNVKFRGASLFPLADAYPNTGSSGTLANYVNEYANVTSTGETVLQLDVSALSGGYYINLSVGGRSSNNGTVYAYDIYLE